VPSAMEARGKNLEDEPSEERGPGNSEDNTRYVLGSFCQK